MGNQASLAQQAGAANHVPGEPLESFSKEKQRDDHLKNLGFKRSKSIRKSIAKRLKRKKRNPSSEDIKDGVSKTSKTSEASSLDTRIEVVERPPDKSDKPLVGVPQPLPAHVQDLDSLEGARPRKMDRLRRSFRASIKRKKDLSTQSLDPTLNADPVVKCVAESTKQWQADEVAVRSGLCNFQVKYLGCVEVFNSRGMEVCEEAVKVLKNSKRKSVRSVLYVSGDGLRVVDDDTRGLILDQTIEKVSFCAPDRNYDRGFSYICRDGTTRRWMCHGFMAIKDSGERLSHAVGCAFAICLERKQKRDSECTVSVSFDSKNASFTRFGSFRQASITERLQDPQVLKPAQPPPIQEVEENPFAIARPHAPDLMLQRQTSFRGFSHLQASGNSPFKRQLSLRLSELPSTLERQRTSGLQLSNAQLAKDNFDTDLRHTSMMPLDEVTEESEQAEASEIERMCQKLTVGLTKLSSVPPQHQQQQQQQSFVNGDHKFPDPSRSILSPRSAKATSPLPPVPENQPLSAPVAPLPLKFPPTEIPSSLLPPPPSSTTTAASKPTAAATSVTAEATSGTSSLDAFLSSVKPMEYDNPWDWVPDQPLRTAFNASKASSSSTCDSTSSGISSGSLASIGGGQQLRHNSNDPIIQNNISIDNHNQFLPLNNGNNITTTTTMDKSIFEVSDFLWSNNEDSTHNHLNHSSYQQDLETTPAAGILEDPFDAEWAALAMRNTTISPSKNPFMNDKLRDPDSGLKKAFELQM